jgi:uncharacterized protein (TIGR02569 family)
VLDLFAVPDVVEPLPGGQGGSVRAGDLVLSPERDPAVATWLSPVLARLAVRLDESPTRGPGDLRVAMPVPARDGSWVVGGWAASRWEPGTTTCRDLDVVLATARLFHARLASTVETRPPGLDARTDRWAVAERAAFGEEALPDRPVVRRAAALLDDTPLGPAQLVHADLAGHVLLDAAGSPVVVDVAPAWRPARWAEAVCVLDSVLWWDADEAVLADRRTGAERQAVLRALLFRAVGDGPEHDQRYGAVLDALEG